MARSSHRRQNSWGRTVGALSATASLVALAGCAGGASPQQADPDAPVTLNFAWWGDASRAERYESAIDLYEKANENVTVRTSYAGFGDYWTARNTEAASRTLPDVIQMDLAYLNEYGSFGHVVPLDDFFGEQIDTSQIDEALVSAGEVDGRTFGLASSASTQATILNVPLLEQLGVEAPTEPLSWDEYDDFLAEVSAAGADADPAVSGAIDYTQYFWLFAIWLGQQDKSLIDGDALGFDKADLAAWWERSAELNDSGAALPPERLNQLEGVDALGAGEIATDISWDNFLPRFSEGPAQPELTLLAPPTDDPDRTGLFLKPGLMLSIGANSKNQAAAADFIDFLVNDPEVGKIFGMSRGIPSSEAAREGIDASPLDEKILDYEESIADTLDGSAPPAVRGLGTLEQTFVTMSQDVAYGTVSVDEAVDRWFAEADNALAG